MNNSNCDVLVFAPHPDDAEIFCGGVVASLASKYRVVIADLTRGELSSRGDIKTRQKEADKAAKILGLSDRLNLGLPDGGIKNEPKQVAKVVTTIRKLKPQTIIFPYSKDRHPDHEAAHQLIKTSIFMSNLARYKTGKLERHQAEYALMYEMRIEMPFSMLVDISAHHQTKLESVMAYSSQILTSKSKNNGPSSFLYNEQATKAISRRSAYYGSMLGVEHAEPLLLLGSIGCKDPIDFLKQSTSAKNMYIIPNR